MVNYVIPCSTSSSATNNVPRFKDDIFSNKVLKMISFSDFFSNLFFSSTVKQKNYCKHYKAFLKRSLLNIDDFVGLTHFFPNAPFLYPPENIRKMARHTFKNLDVWTLQYF